MMQVETETGFPASGVVMHPSDWLTMQLAREGEGTGTYLGDGPFVQQEAQMWGVPVARTSRIARGSAIVGAFEEAGAVLRKGGIRVDASTSHGDHNVRVDGEPGAHNQTRDGDGSLGVALNDCG